MAEPPSSDAGQRADDEGERAASCQQKVQQSTPGLDAQESQSGGACPVAEEVQSLKAAITELQVCLLVLQSTVLGVVPGAIAPGTPGLQ